MIGIICLNSHSNRPTLTDCTFIHISVVVKFTLIQESISNGTHRHINCCYKHASILIYIRKGNTKNLNDTTFYWLSDLHINIFPPPPHTLYSSHPAPGGNAKSISRCHCWHCTLTATVTWGSTSGSPGSPSMPSWLCWALSVTTVGAQRSPLWCFFSGLPAPPPIGWWPGPSTCPGPPFTGWCTGWVGRSLRSCTPLFATLQERNSHA